MRLVRGFLLLFLIAGFLVVAGCTPLVSSFPTATPEKPVPVESETAPQPTATITSTPTIEWFPATATPTPLPAVVKSPTPDLLAAGELAYRDDFSDPDLWVIYQVVGSNITILNEDITFDLDGNSGLAYAFRSAPLLTNYSARITVSPGYCGETDEYGLMARITGVRRDHYRFVVTCDGRAGVFRVVNDRAIQIADWVRHPILASSFPAARDLAFRVEGRELLFFVNDQLLITVQDAVIPRGTAGVFMRAVSGEPVLVSFSELEVYSISVGGD